MLAITQSALIDKSQKQNQTERLTLGNEKEKPNPSFPENALFLGDRLGQSREEVPD